MTKFLYCRIPTGESLFERSPSPIETGMPMANQFCDCSLQDADEVVPCGKIIDSKTYEGVVIGTVNVPTGVMSETDQDSGSPLVNDHYDPSDFDQALDSTNNLEIDWPTVTGITEEEAREYCNTGIKESPVYLACVDYTDNVEEIIANCMSDVKVVIHIFI